MNDTPHHTRPADWDPPMPSEAELLAAVARNEAELAAGSTVPAETVHRRIRDAIARIEAKKHAEQAADLVEYLPGPSGRSTVSCSITRTGSATAQRVPCSPLYRQLNGG